MKRSWIKIAVMLLFLIPFSVIHAQETSRETTATVPALTEFHKVIYEIWHNGWPNRDYELLRALLPEITQGTAAIVNAELPGILRDKKDAWKKGVEDLRNIVQEYRSAVDSKQEQPLLNAAEMLHTQYEALVRVIRPPLKELEEFHARLYMLYHHHMPGESLSNIEASIGPLREKMAVLNTATLPRRFKGKEASFMAARSELDRAVTDFGEAASSKDLEKIRIAVETMHERYVTLAAILD